MKIDEDRRAVFYTILHRFSPLSGPPSLKSNKDMEAFIDLQRSVKSHYNSVPASGQARVQLKSDANAQPASALLKQLLPTPQPSVYCSILSTVLPSQ